MSADTGEILSCRRLIAFALIIVTGAGLFTVARPQWMSSFGPDPGGKTLNAIRAPSPVDSAPSRTTQDWQLLQLGGSEATLTQGSPVAKVAFQLFLPGPQWQTLLSRAVGPIHEGSSYIMRFDARAEVPKAIDVGLRSSTVIGEDCGLRSRVDLTSDWQTFSLPFRCGRSVNRALARFDLGGSGSGVEVRDVRLERDGKS